MGKNETRGCGFFKFPCTCATLLTVQDDKNYGRRGGELQRRSVCPYLQGNFAYRSLFRVRDQLSTSCADLF